MKKILILAGFVLASFAVSAQGYVQLSVDFLRAIEANKNTDKYLTQFEQIDNKKFMEEVNTDAEKLTFWMNLYNGMIQDILKKNPKAYEDRGAFFAKKQVPFAGKMLSFDTMEHGVLRKGVSKKSWGYFSNPFGSDWHEDYEVKETDWRIHFALNCGAKDCPPIRIYESETIYEQLNASAQQYMDKQVNYKPEKEEVYVPALMSWFRADFGGLDGGLEILKEYNKVPKDKHPNLEFKDYDWTLALGTFYND